MKKIAIVTGLLLMAIVAMAYLYFSKLNADQQTSDVGLHAATASSGLIFTFQNEKGITDILKDQPIFSEILGKEKYQQLSAIKKNLLNLPVVSHETENQYLYLAFVPGSRQETDFMCFTQILGTSQTSLLLQSIRGGGTQVETLNQINKLTMPDSTVCYLAIKGHLAIVSNSQQQITLFLTKKQSAKTDPFAEFIRTGDKLNKNSLAQLHINYNTLPLLLKNIISSKLNGTLSVLHDQHAFASLAYNYSKDKVLLTGTTMISNASSYHSLFADLQTQKTSIQNILPANTASYTIFAIDNYIPWRKKLSNWMKTNKEDKKAGQLIEGISNKYHLNLEDIFPRYFKNQMVTFQLSNGEKLGAINLSNGDKLTQLLIDLSTNHNEDIKSLNEADLLYTYFGPPFQDFKKPFYTILDNYMVFANNAATLQGFLTSYSNNSLLINTPNYISASNQLSGNANISFYIDRTNAAGLLQKNIYLPYHKHLQSDKGLKKYSSFTCQLSGDGGKFQTNILIDKLPDVLQKDSLAL